MVRNVQIIVAALAIGMIIFAGIAVSQRLNQPPQQNEYMAYFALGFTVVLLGVRRVVGSGAAARHRKSIAEGKGVDPGSGNYGLPAAATDGDRLLLVFQQKTIVESALVEGPSFFVIIAFLIGGQWWLLGIAGVLLTMLLVPFPTYERIEDWVKYQLELMELEKQ
jgi:hypothetical protein